MKTIQKKNNQKPPGTLKKFTSTASDDKIHHLAFDNSLQANIISSASTGKIIIANNAACKLFGYSKKELLTKSRSSIFNINESSFKKMLHERTAEGHSMALVTAIKKSGMLLPCEITSAVFMDDDGGEKAITTIADISQSILRQKNIDAKKEKKVADNIIIAKLKQKVIDARKERIVAHNIVLAKSKQRKIDTKKEKIVAHNIITAQVKSDTRLADNKEWIQYIAKASYDVMWDWDIATGEIYLGDSVKEVFGYRAENNIIAFKDFVMCLIPKEREAVEKKLLKALASRSKSWTDDYMLKRQDGSIAATTSRASIVRNEAGKAIRLIGAIQNVSRLQELEKTLSEQITTKKENSEIFQLAAKLSYDGIWDWNILTNDFFLGEGLEELFGRDIKKSKGNMVTDWSNYLHPDDKESVLEGLQDAIGSTATHWEHAYRFLKTDGSIAEVYGRASIIRNTDGKACRMIGVIHNLSRQKELEDKLNIEMASNVKQFTDYKESFKLIFNSSSDVIYDIDLVANEIKISDAFEKEFGYKITSKMTPEEDWANHIHPDDKKAVLKDYSRMLASGENEWKNSYRFFRADGSVANILSSGVILRNADGQACRMIVSMHDISKQTVLEERLEREIKLKERHIAEATAEAKETERSDIGKELHDNVNQLLGASRLYLELAKRGGVNSEMYLGRSSEYTLTAIEEIRKLTKGLTTDIIKNIGLAEAINNLTRDTMELNPVKISSTLEHFIERNVNDKFKQNIFRIVQEQLNNIVKHAKATKVTIGLSQNKTSITLIISDNGVGFDVAKKRKGIGIDNIKSRLASYGGTADFVSQPGQGCVLTAIFPITDALLKKK
ncbi:MAG: PAS domain-containing protein [Ferruginibacter sp.]